MKTIFKITIELPKSKHKKEVIFAAEDAQKQLLSLFNIKIISD